MSELKRPVTIQDVAHAAGVSVSTVSRVLNDKDDVAEATYAHVQTVIAELGYTSSLAAKSMRSRQTNVIGMVMPDLEESFPVEVMKGVNHAIAQYNYDLIVYTNGDIHKNTTAEKERHYVSLLNNSITDGVIIVTPVTTTFSTNSPVVAVDPNNESPNCPAVIATNRDGALSAMDYLLQLGHRRIGYVGGRPDLQSAIRRRQGYTDGLQQAGIPVDTELIQVGDFTMESAYLCAQQLLSVPQRPTAVFAANDQS
ncbi:MAG: LacI family DNA-binding transcriptional regulator, partial [Anaerolineales bacterium]|nr:LacI family DNA-binding transcriptional regulator [Anaerolineales bacterium]